MVLIRHYERIFYQRINVRFFSKFEICRSANELWWSGWLQFTYFGMITYLSDFFLHKLTYFIDLNKYQYTSKCQSTCPSQLIWQMFQIWYILNFEKRTSLSTWYLSTLKTQSLFTLIICVCVYDLLGIIDFYGAIRIKWRQNQRKNAIAIAYIYTQCEWTLRCSLPHYLTNFPDFSNIFFFIFPVIFQCSTFKYSYIKIYKNKIKIVYFF